MAFTELFCKTTGDNRNGGGIAAGTEPTDAAAYTSTNGNWNGTSSFTPTDGSTPASSVNVGDFASVYVDGSTVTGYVARVTAVAAGVNGAITLSTTAKSGTAPTSSVTTRTIKVGGAWKGPNGAEGFPFGFIAATLTNAAGNFPRVNFKSGTYAITAQMTHNLAGPTRFQGYATTPGDSGKATIDGGTVGASYILLVINTVATNCDLLDFILQNNGASASANCVFINASKALLGRCVFSNCRGSGLSIAASNVTVFECEAFGTNQAAGSNPGLNSSGSGTIFIRCISHDNSGGISSHGFAIASSGSATFICCIADTNSGEGFLFGGTVSVVFIGCDSYNNIGNGIKLGNTSPGSVYIENCNFLKNGGYGVLGDGVSSKNGAMLNCGFGSGTQANTSGQSTGLNAMNEVGSVTYPANTTPWVDPANGDFRVNLAQAKGAGRGSFTQTQAGYAGTTAYPDIGAAQHQESAAGACLPIIGTHGPIIRGLVA